MAKAIGRSSLMLVELDKGILAKTTIPTNNHAALRAGFAGFTCNPRWCGSKFVAWRTGKAWKQELEAGKLAVRSTDSLLVPAEEARAADEKPKTQKPGLLTHLAQRQRRMEQAPQL